jgi:hypothetical protein
MGRMSEILKWTVDRAGAMTGFVSYGCRDRAIPSGKHRLLDGNWVTIKDDGPVELIPAVTDDDELQCVEAS